MDKPISIQKLVRFSALSRAEWLLLAGAEPVKPWCLERQAARQQTPTNGREPRRPPKRRTAAEAARPPSTRPTPPETSQTPTSRDAPADKVADPLLASTAYYPSRPNTHTGMLTRCAPRRWAMEAGLKVPVQTSRVLGRQIRCANYPKVLFPQYRTLATNPSSLFALFRHGRTTPGRKHDESDITSAARDHWPA